MAEVEGEPPGADRSGAAAGQDMRKQNVRPVG
jgi:hypothetical protein